MGREFECKYAASEAAMAALLPQHGPWTQIRMETTYFDTADGALSAQKMTLRLRKENGVTVCTLKTPLPDGSRGEWECEAENIESGIQALLALGAPQLLEDLTGQGVHPQCGARFIRLATKVPTADGVAELALDRGVLLGGGRERALCEVEIELKSGSEEATLALAQAIATRFQLTEEPNSKFRRALNLALGE